MSKAFLGERGNSLEESFFAKENEALRRWLRKAEETKTKKDSLSAASGIRHADRGAKIIRVPRRRQRQELP